MKYKFLNVPVSKELKSEVRIRAAKEGVTMSEFARRAIRKAITQKQRGEVKNIEKSNR